MEKLKEVRKSLGLTQANIAKQLGISESYYSQLENGKRRMSLVMAIKIASILGKTPDEFFLPSNFAIRK